MLSLSAERLHNSSYPDQVRFLVEILATILMKDLLYTAKM